MLSSGHPELRVWRLGHSDGLEEKEIPGQSGAGL